MTRAPDSESEGEGWRRGLGLPKLPRTAVNTPPQSRDPGTASAFRKRFIRSCSCVMSLNLDSITYVADRRFEIPSVIFKLQKLSLEMFLFSRKEF